MGNLTSSFFSIPKQYFIGSAAKYPVSFTPDNCASSKVPLYRAVKLYVAGSYVSKLYKVPTLSRESVIQFCSAQWWSSTPIHWRSIQEEKKKRSKQKTMARSQKKMITRGFMTKYTASLLPRRCYTRPQSGSVQGREWYTVWRAFFAEP